MRFTIRDVLWLMVVVGMGVGWWRTVKYQSDYESLIETRLSAAEARDFESRQDLGIQKAINRAMSDKLGPGSVGWWRDDSAPDGFAAEWEPSSN